MLSIYIKQLLRQFLLLTLAIVVFSLISAAQQTPSKDDPLEMPADDFVRTRGIGDITNAADTFKFKKPTYRLKRKLPRPKRLGTSSVTQKNVGGNDLPSDTKSAEQWETIGVTVWRDTSDGTPIVNDKETGRLIVQESGKDKVYTPIRANADTVFKLGDKVRLSIESPREGCLYIIDREMLGGEKLGPPMQIFPTMLSRGGNNELRPGQLVDIPAQNDPFFELRSTTAGYQGELLTIIFSPTPLKDMTVPARPDFIAAALVDEMEKRYLHDAAEYEQQGTDGKAYTKAEKEAGGDGKRQLTQTDPYPQTKYRVKVRPKEPMMINIALSVK